MIAAVIATATLRTAADIQRASWKNSQYHRSDQFVIGGENKRVGENDTHAENRTGSPHSRSSEGQQTPGGDRRCCSDYGLLDTTTKNFQVQKKRADDAEGRLSQMTLEKTESQQELSAWKALGYTPDQIRNLRTQLAKTGEERDAITGENTR